MSAKYLFMDIQIISTPLHLVLHGFGGLAPDKDYAGTAFRLSGKMWEIIKTQGIKNKGKNTWVYEAGDNVFAGVELDNPGETAGRLEVRRIQLDKYAYYKHTGSYKLIGQAGQAMKNELTKQGYKIVLPYIEIYGHWTGQDHTTETELIMCLE